MRLSILKLEKSYHLLCKDQTDHRIHDPHHCRQLHSCLCEPMRFFPVTAPDALCDLNLSSHTRHGRQPLGKPGKHSPDADSRHCLGAKKSDPRHVRDVVKSSKKR